MTKPDPARPTFADFEALDLKIGRVTRCEPNTGAREPSFCLWIDFGDPGVLQSSAKLTDLYEPDDLVGTQVVAVTGFAPMRVGGFRSDVLVLGAIVDEGVVLLRPDRTVDPGAPVA
ncbi:MAG: tRNA-binding protein [Armatimonadetes bacterium]|nr:MAG: tRNA-binding protein [Armatimonadota bacterium]